MTGHVQIYKLGIAPLFDLLSDWEKRYGHYLSRAAWSGTRIILRQVSPESLTIFDFILELYGSCGGDWHQLSGVNGVTAEDLGAFLEYAATFLSNIGNYYGSGDQKFIPRMSPDALEQLASRSSKLSNLYKEIQGSIMAIPPFTLGYPGVLAQSSYYPGAAIKKEEIALVSKHMDAHSILPENTRIRKLADNTFEVLQASVEPTKPAVSLDIPGSPASVNLVGGDHAEDLKKVCSNLSKAAEYAANDTQRKFLAQYIESFQTGSLDVYRDSQRTWVTDRAPKVENIFGFVEPYRDPAGIRAEFEGLVAIADAEETKLLSRLVENSDKFIRRLPWASTENNGKGAFEKSLFEPPDFSSIHALAYCSSIIFPGINLPNYNDIRQDVGFKNVIIANRMIAESTAMQWPFIDDSEMETFKSHKYPAYYWWVVLHELLGHGTGKMMVEEPANKFNFDPTNPPTNPLNGKPIETWYKPGQTWTGQFGDLATTLDECRAELVGAYLMDDPELLALFGFADESAIRASDLTFNLYQQLGVDGLRALSNYSTDGMRGLAYANLLRAHFAMLRCLLRHGHGCVRIDHDAEAGKLRVRVDRSKISHGKKALGDMLLRLHMHRCTANVQECRKYYEDLSHVDEECLNWRQTVIENKPPPLLNVQGNTFIDGETVTLKEYEPTITGIIHSWYEREV
ncbi:dipeptidyl peptidase III [Hypoxylon sp. FL0543]|nr:dipeptidyl peptidase III [Hypoxylon sp. FL0543]